MLYLRRLTRLESLHCCLNHDRLLIESSLDIGGIKSRAPPKISRKQFSEPDYVSTRRHQCCCCSELCRLNSQCANPPDKCHARRVAGDPVEESANCSPCARIPHSALRDSVEPLPNDLHCLLTVRGLDGVPHLAIPQNSIRIKNKASVRLPVFNLLLVRDECCYRIAEIRFG